eukprot:2078588-Rhodomonas_salina.1
MPAPPLAQALPPSPSFTSSSVKRPRGREEPGQLSFVPDSDEVWEKRPGEGGRARARWVVTLWWTLARRLYYGRGPRRRGGRWVGRGAGRDGGT